MSAEIKTYILSNVDNLNKVQQKELLLYINRLNSSSIKANADGSRVNLDKLDIRILKKIESFIRNLTEYNSFYQCKLSCHSIDGYAQNENR